MTLDEIWAAFSATLVEIELHQHATRETARLEMRDLQRLDELLQERSDHGEDIAHYNMSFHDAKTGERILYGNKSISLYEARLRVGKRKNRNYQWLLAEAYEAYEMLLKRVYAILGAAGADCWLLKDYGSITRPESLGKDYQWHLNKLRGKQDLPLSILTPIRKKFPSLRSDEKINQYDIDLAFVVALVSRFRNLIVHNQGKLPRQENLVDEVAKKIGALNNGTPPSSYAEFAANYIGSKRYQDDVVLLEYRMNDDPLPGRYWCRLSELIERLASHAHLVLETVRTDLVMHNSTLDSSR